MQFLRGLSFVGNNYRDCGAASRNVIVMATAMARKPCRTASGLLRALCTTSRGESRVAGIQIHLRRIKLRSLAEKLTNAYWQFPAWALLNAAISQENPFENGAKFVTVPSDQI